MKYVCKYITFEGIIYIRMYDIDTKIFLYHITVFLSYSKRSVQSKIF